MYITPETLQQMLAAWKREIFSSLHAVLPGLIRSYDPDTGLAIVQPGLSGKGSDGKILTAPILEEVPVFLPSSDFIVSAGSFCLLFFMDGCLDGFLASRQPVLPASPRHHDLSDAIALVGWFPCFDAAIPD